jgi:hypothetical protein
LVLAALTLVTPALAQGRRALSSNHPQAQSMGHCWIVDWAPNN